MNLTPNDIADRKVIIRDPKSGKEAEVAFQPQKVADRLQKYVSDNGVDPSDRIFPTTYAAARIVVKKAGTLVGLHPRPRPVTPIFGDNSLRISYPSTLTGLNHIAPGRAETPRFT